MGSECQYPIVACGVYCCERVGKIQKDLIEYVAPESQLAQYLDPAITAAVKRILGGDHVQ
ncbi:hypothetical protein GCM10027217_47850 [Pseudomaricurvus hydrocarbonicus]